MVKYNEEHISHIFHALADPTRREILRLVSVKEKQVSELADSFHMSFPAVSKHLKVLEKAKLVRRQIDGRIHHISFEDKTMKKAYQWIKYYERFWQHSLDNLESFLMKTDDEKED